MDKWCKGYFTTLDGEQFYKIENYDCMEDFFMTITSSSDIWNFCWSQGGVTAGRIDCDHAIFPYYTADKVSDAKSYTGPYTAIAVIKNGRLCMWEPFAPLYCSEVVRTNSKNVIRNIYKNTTGTCVWFEEINNELQLVFRYAWTSSAKYGLVRKSFIQNLSAEKVSCVVLDGCRNILPPCCTAEFQNNNSVLLDAYKKTDLDTESNLALFALSSIVSDKAEPSEGLLTNSSWFSTNDHLLLDPETPTHFVAKAIEAGEQGALPAPDSISQMLVVKGKRPSCFICRSVDLGANGSSADSDKWFQVFDTSLDACGIALLKKSLADKKQLTAELTTDIAAGEKLMQEYIAHADGIQNTAETMTCTHHSANVMFNIMRGGIFANGGKFNPADFVLFVTQRNKAKITLAKETLKDALNINNNLLKYDDAFLLISHTNDKQLLRLFYEYMPITFSRRHGDPSRPWNRFNIKLRDENGNPILNYEGNWRDIFQNWEALAWSYPQYTKNMLSKFLNAMTVDGFNPYRISREGIDWEVPEPNNPWSSIGYWGDHQVIYLEKFLELFDRTNHTALINSLDEQIYVSSNIPYRIKSYKDIVDNPRDTILFDRPLSMQLVKNAKENGSDAKLVLGTDGQPALVSLTAKLLQIVITKAANFIPGGGIWLNTQRPEWNDANNALAGYGLSMVTLCYLYRYISFLIKMYACSPQSTYSVPLKVAECFEQIAKLYAENKPNDVATDEKKRRVFVDRAGAAFEAERNALYAEGYTAEKRLSAEEIINALTTINIHVEQTIRMNKRSDGLYHAYNTMKISSDAMQIEYLQEMLEGQVAVLSSGLLSPTEALDLLSALRQSKMYEARQNSYMLYPNKELAHFCKKNCVSKSDTATLTALINRSGTKILAEDCNGVYHFNPNFRNARVMEETVNAFGDAEKPTATELATLKALYEKTFNHQSFTGRSGTFYAYEGLGSIYWHMVAKLLVATQENVFIAEELCSKNKCATETARALASAYYDIRKGIGFNKEPSLYGAFPADPYSHTPAGQGAKQPGMTGQVKEEVLTRWGELGITIVDGIASFNPTLLHKSEFFKDKTLSFTWCGVPVTYHLSNSDSLSVKTENNIESLDGIALSKQLTAALINRTGSIKSIDVYTTLARSLVE